MNWKSIDRKQTKQWSLKKKDYNSVTIDSCAHFSLPKNRCSRSTGQTYQSHNSTSKININNEKSSAIISLRIPIGEKVTTATILLGYIQLQCKLTVLWLSFCFYAGVDVAVLRLFVKDSLHFRADGWIFFQWYLNSISRMKILLFFSYFLFAGIVVPLLLYRCRELVTICMALF